LRIADLATAKTMELVTKNKDWFKALFDDNYEYVRNYIYYLSGDIVIAEDIVQEVFLKIWEKQSELKHETLKALIFTIARNLYFNQHKRNILQFRFQNSYLSKIEHESPEYLLEMKEFDRNLQKAISDLPEKCRTYFLMNRIDERKYNEIADMMGVSVKAVEKQISKAIKILKKQTELKF
jgi:RNA polymerase sigma-70 factor (family 1)